MGLFDNDNNPPLPFSIPEGEGYSYKYNSEKKVFEIQVPNGELVYAEHFSLKK